MPVDPKQTVRVYTERLVNSLVPPDFGTEYPQRVAADLLPHLLSGKSASASEVNNVLDRYKSRFLAGGRNEEWTRFASVISSLLKLRTVDEVKSHLQFLGAFSGTRFDSETTPGASIAGPAIHSSPYASSVRSPSAGKPTVAETMENLIKPYYEVIPEDEIIRYLPYALTGVDSKLFTFTNRDKIRAQLPDRLNNSYSSILSKVLEPALIYVKLTTFLSSSAGHTNSPIKTCFVSHLEKLLNEYVEFVNKLFTSNLTSIMAVNNLVYPYTLRLRLLYSLTNDLTLSGYEFLSRVHKLSKFGDYCIKNLATDIFNLISVPYYQVLEHWIVRGELMDDTGDFFITFDKEQTHIHDIIKFLPKKVPDFLVNNDKELGFQIFQIGKILIFLTRYCKELQWVNSYVIKYSQYIFDQNGGLRLLNMSAFTTLIATQYNELVNYLTYVIHTKYVYLEHLNNYRRFLLMGSGDFMDAIISKGADLFNQPSNMLTTNQLSKVLFEAIKGSSVVHCDAEFQNRLDARVLDLSHGNIGWQVFTIEYKVDDLPINIITNYKNLNLEYLKMFNFLWKIKQFAYFLDLSFTESSNLKRNELKRFYERLRNMRGNLRDTKIAWVVKSFNTINLIRSRMIHFLNALMDYVSFELIQTNFEEMSSTLRNHDQSKIRQSKLSILDSQFSELIKAKTLDYNLPKTELIENTAKELNFDELITINQKYCEGLTGFTILGDTSVGEHSGQTYIEQIYSVLDLIFMFIKSNEEYNGLLVNYVALLNIEENMDVNQLDNDLEYSEESLKKVVFHIYKQIYPDFTSTVSLLVKDMKGDIELRHFARTI